ncbi:MAG: N-acetyl-gamma-glutamyl-phosphate reductase [Synergistes sp.]|nr:N-acetyl-gamma-glutamyl-phosphate reductase [Synergistes sp.]
MSGKFSVTIWGATGYAGAELMRIIARHPHFEIAAAVSRSKAGTSVGAVHPHLRHVYNALNFISPDDAAAIKTDVAFLALPHRASAAIAVKLLETGVRVVDLSADFRLRSAGEYKNWYGIDHPAPQYLSQAVYGLPELHRAEMPQARIISGVGCNATATITALLPIARAGLIEDARIECRVGSSESGAGADAGSAHSVRARALRVVTPFVHRHAAEVTQELGLAISSFTMGVTAVELVRGIQCLAHVTLKEKVREADLWKLYRGTWNEEPFVSFTPANPTHFRIPDPRFVIGSNRVLTGFMLADDGKRMIAASAIDNLIKGAAGSAVQSANIMFGLNETDGLDMMPIYPA